MACLLPVSGIFTPGKWYTSSKDKFLGVFALVYFSPSGNRWDSFLSQSTKEFCNFSVICGNFVR